jgi:hypothetical protein
MLNVPKIVSDRLRVAPPAVNHPDADMLTAFSERSLSELERGIVLEHLARCGDCRDIVALALPAMEPVETVVKPSHSGWLAWPALRWGFVAAGVLAVASVGMLRLQRHPPIQMASNRIATQPVQKSQATGTRNQLSAPPAPAAVQKQAPSHASPAPVVTDSLSLDRENTAGGESKGIVASELSSAPSRKPRIGSGAGMAPGGFPHGPKMAMQQQQNGYPFQQAPAPAAPPVTAKQVGGNNVVANAPVPPASETVEVQSGADEVAQNQSTDLPVNGRSAGQLSSSLDDSAKVGKAKPAETVQVQVSSAASLVSTNPPTQSEPLPAYAVPIPRWTVNSNGGLQRSFDQGKTWQDIDVNANPAPRDFTSLEVVASTSRAKAAAKDTKTKKEDEKNKKAFNERDAAVTFRAVAANGAEVWAGGSAGALYHSADAGNHWTRIMPSAEGTVLTADIIALEFSDAQHGKVTTADSAIWTTSDAGQSWQKQ